MDEDETLEKRSEEWKKKRMEFVKKKPVKEETISLVTTRSMKAKLDNILDETDEHHDLKRKNEATENLFQCFDLNQMIKKVKQHNQERRTGEELFDYPEESKPLEPEKDPEVKIESPVIPETKKESPLKNIGDILESRKDKTPEKTNYCEEDEDEIDPNIIVINPLEHGIIESPFAEVKQLEPDSEKKIEQVLSEDKLNIEVDIKGLGEYQSIIEKKTTGVLDDYSEKYRDSKSKMNNNYKPKKYKDGTYINCDLRYFNLSNLGSFDCVMIDPPWRLLGGQKQGEEANMFSNTSFKLNYQTLSNEEIIDINVESLSESGFCFLWVMNSQLQFGLTCLNKWGYTYVDRLVWVKRSKTSNTTINISTGYYFLHSVELCLVGVKHSTKNTRLEYISKVSNDVIFGRVGIQSQKPDEIYQIIDTMVPGGRKIELFAKNHNLRKGWLSLGNRLGPTFEPFVWSFTCSICTVPINHGNPRYKHKKIPGKDICSDCIKKEEKIEYHKFDNDLDETAYHDWYTCDVCKQYPICGVKFSCKTCGDFDLCEACYDIAVLTEKQHENHNFDVREVPEQGAGFPVHHRIRCTSCLTCPIIGERFHCLECQDVNLCRNCFFKQKEVKTHKKVHDIQLIPEAKSGNTFKCESCKSQIENQPVFKCKTCSNFILCETCYEQHSDLFPFESIPSHKEFHPFMKLK